MKDLLIENFLPVFRLTYGKAITLEEFDVGPSVVLTTQH